MNPQHTQTAERLLEKYRQGTAQFSDQIFNLINHQPAESSQIRAQLTELLKTDFSADDLPLIRLLFDYELKAEVHSEDGSTLYQLAYYLYISGDLKDVYRIYEAKYLNQNEASAALIDVDMLLMGKRVQAVMDFVEFDFKQYPSNQERYGEILKVLDELSQLPEHTQKRMSGVVREYSGDNNAEELSEINLTRYIIMSALTEVINFESQLDKQGINFVKEEATNIEYGYPTNPQTRYYFRDEDYETASELAEKVIKFETIRESKASSGNFLARMIGSIGGISLALTAIVIMIFLAAEYFPALVIPVALLALLMMILLIWKTIQR